MKANFCIVGQPKSGTTSLYAWLTAHNDVHMSPIKEPHFFCNDFHIESDNYHARKLFFPIRSESAYNDLFKKVQHQKIIGEASTNYLYSASAATNMSAYNPDMKIVMVLRNPIDFIDSLHAHYVRFGEEDVPELKKALELEQHRKNGLHIPRNVTAPSYVFYSQRIRYYQQVQRFYSQFRSDQIHVVLFDELHRNSEQTLGSLCNFLDIQLSESTPFSCLNPRKKARSKYIAAVCNNPSLKRIVARLCSQQTTEWMRDKIYNKYFCATDTANTDSNKEECFIEDTRLDLAKTSDLIGMNLIEYWNF